MEQQLSSNPSRVIHVFLTENHVLRLGNTESLPCSFTQQETVPVIAGGHGLIKLTNPHYPLKAEKRSSVHKPDILHPMAAPRNSVSEKL